MDVADDGIHKLVYTTESGRKVKFGRLGYGDYIIYSLKDKALAEKKRHIFNSSHSKIKGDWRKDVYSPNYLALRILWDWDE